MYVAKLPALKLAGSAQSLTSVATVATFFAEAKVQVPTLAFLVSTAVVSTGAVVVQYILQPIIASSSGQTILGTITIPAGTAAGQVYRNNIGDGAVLLPGYTIQVNVTTAAAGGGAAGAGYAMFEDVAESPESPVNFTNSVLVTV